MEEKNFATADKLIQGSNKTKDILLEVDGENMWVTIRSLNLSQAMLVQKASKNNEEESAAWLVKSALVKPALSTEQIQQLDVGIVTKLANEINKLSGLDTSDSDKEIKTF